MTKCAKFVACVGMLCLGIASAAPAEPITLTAGSLVFSHWRAVSSRGSFCHRNARLLP